MMKKIIEISKKKFKVNFSRDYSYLNLDVHLIQLPTFIILPVYFVFYWINSQFLLICLFKILKLKLK